MSALGAAHMGGEAGIEAAARRGRERLRQRAALEQAAANGDTEAQTTLDTQRLEREKQRAFAEVQEVGSDRSKKGVRGWFRRHMP